MSLTTTWGSSATWANELEVQDGYRHQVIGTVVVEYGSGDCMAGPIGKRDLIGAMQEAAWATGGNAVTYARTEWDESTSGYARCQPIEIQEPVYASGWVVAVAPSPLMVS